MGLDMYAFVIPAKQAQKVVDQGLGKKPRQIAYWRKFNALHRWMRDLYLSKGGKDETFNCNTVKVTGEDLARLEQALNDGALLPMTGFFFGAPDIYPEHIEDTRKFIADAREEIKNHNAVYYDSWW